MKYISEKWENIIDIYFGNAVPVHNVHKLKYHKRVKYKNITMFFWQSRFFEIILKSYETPSILVMLFPLKI